VAGQQNAAESRAASRIMFAAVRAVFVTVGAFLGRIDSATRCAFWADDPTEHDFDPQQLIAVDLARTPSAAIAGDIPWDAVEVDDSFNGPNGQVLGTTLGASWPELQLVGLVCLHQQFWRRLPDAIRPTCPPRGANCHDHEFMSVVYWPHTTDPRAGKRYCGHHAQILEERGGLARVAVYPPGASQRPNARPAIMWIDLASPEQCDAGPESLTTIAVGDGPKSGALFLILGSLEP
jgi:hypothetical protein